MIIFHVNFFLETEGLTTRCECEIEKCTASMLMTSAIFYSRFKVYLRKECFTRIARVMWKVIFLVGPIDLAFPETFRTFVQKSSTKSWKFSKNETTHDLSDWHRLAQPGPHSKPKGSPDNAKRAYLLILLDRESRAFTVYGRRMCDFKGAAHDSKTTTKYAGLPGLC